MPGTPTRRIPIGAPWITERELTHAPAIARRNGYGHSEGDRELEEAFAASVGVAHAISLDSRTAAIHLSLVALGIGQGDEIIVPDITWIASAALATYVGATPVFADIDPVTWCIDVPSVAACISSRTKAIVAVDLYGGLPDWADLRQLADRYGIPIIEDAAEALGTTCAGVPAGSFGDVGVFSLHGSQTVSTGEGGMLVMDDEAIYERCLQLREEGRERAAREELSNEEIVFGYRMSAAQAGLGLAQLERLPDLVARKRLIFDWYLNGLGGLAGVTLNAEPAGVENSYWMTTVLLDRELQLSKDEVIDQLDEAGIEARPFFDPLSSAPAFVGPGGRDRGAVLNPVAYALSPYGVSLPSALSLTADEVDYVCATMRRILGY